MKKKPIILITLLVLISTILAGCNYTTKVWGGTMKYALPANQKLVNVTWKDAELWYLTKPMTSGDVAETYYFTEKSNLGMFEGTVVITESKN